MVSAAFVFLAASPLLAQGKDDFARAVVDAINADQEPPEKRGAAMAAAVAAMAAGLRTWDAAVASVEAGLAKEIGSATPEAGSRMRMALGAVYLERGRNDAAAAQFEIAATLNRASAEPHLFRGMALERGGKPAAAVEAYRQAWLRQRANAVAAYQFLRAARTVKGTPATEAPRAALLAAVAPGAPPFTLLTADLLDDAMSQAPVMPSIAFADAFSLLRRGRYDEAVVRFRAALKAPAVGDRISPADVVGRLKGFVPVIGAAPLFARLGREAHARLDLDAAVAAYEQRVAAAPNDSGAHYDLAEVYRARDDVESALVEAAAAALLDPGNARPLVAIGQLHAARGNDDEARRVLERAVAMAPDDPEARYALSRALLRLGQTDAAERELEVFRRLQARAMEAERQRFEDNFKKIEETLKSPQPAGGKR